MKSNQTNLTTKQSGIENDGESNGGQDENRWIFLT